MTATYDPKVYRLAKMFLMDEPGATPAHADLLAKYLQGQIEEWLQYDPDSPRKADK
jgi:hypothetical protein